jgi:hypothetical protein
MLHLKPVYTPLVLRDWSGAAPGTRLYRFSSRSGLTAIFFVSVFAAAVALSALTGCTRTSYAIHTNDGRTIVSDGKPKESDSGLLGYTDANGVKQQINKTDVKEVSEIPH